jgi:hypothetical protein
MLIIGVLILLILFVALAFVVTNNCNDGNDGHDGHHNCDDSSSDDCPIGRPIDDCNNSSFQQDASSGFAEKSSKPPGWYVRNHRKH